MKVGLVLEGGGMRGMYTAGVLDAFLDNNIKVDGIIGVSAGALFGVNYVSGQRGRALNYNTKYIKHPMYMGMKSLIKTGNIVNKEFAYYVLPKRFDVFNQEAFAKANIDYYATVTNVETFEPEYIKIDDVFEQMEVLRASSALPFVSKVVEYDDKKYLDGGISDSIPINKCIDMGYDKIIVVLTRPIEYRKKEREKNILYKLLHNKYGKLADLMFDRAKNYNETVEKIIDLENKKEIFVIRPTSEVKIGRLEKDKQKIIDIYNLGFKDCNHVIRELQNYLSTSN